MNKKRNGTFDKIRVCARCSKVYRFNPCKCEFGTYGAVRALGWWATIKGLLGLDKWLRNRL